MEGLKNIPVIPPDPKYDSHSRIEQQENSYEAIISKELFYQVQEEMKSRSVNMKQNLRKRYSSAYPLSGFIICSGCNSTYNRVTW